VTVLPSLPVIDVYLAFNPTNGTTLVESGLQALPASGASNTYWTNVSKFVRDFDTKSGRQHFLDRVEVPDLGKKLHDQYPLFFPYLACTYEMFHAEQVELIVPPGPYDNVVMLDALP
jgi:hypothetical protein